MKIKDEHLDMILLNPRLFSEVFLLMNTGDKIEVSPKALETQLKKRYKIAKSSIILVGFLRKKGFADSEIFENNIK